MNVFLVRGGLNFSLHIWITSIIKKAKEGVQRNEHSIWMNNVGGSVVE